MVSVMLIYKCINKTVKVNIEKSINYSEAELQFWLERFVPGISSINTKKTNFVINLKSSNYNNIIEGDEKSILSGTFNKGFESSLAKYVSQIFAKLLIIDEYFLIPGACVEKDSNALILVGDVWQGKTSVACSLIENFNYYLISDNYLIIKDNKVIAGTKYISVREENKSLLDKIHADILIERNNRKFYSYATNHYIIF